jgi:hypothetical protein
MKTVVVSESPGQFACLLREAFDVERALLQCGLAAACAARSRATAAPASVSCRSATACASSSRHAVSRTTGSWIASNGDPARVDDTSSFS